MTLFELDRMIEALEKSSPTFGNCQKLASLYICRDNLPSPTIKCEKSDPKQKSGDLKFT